MVKNGIKSNMIRDYMLFFISFFILIALVLYLTLVYALPENMAAAGLSDNDTGTRGTITPAYIFIIISIPFSLLAAAFVLINLYIQRKYRNKVARVEEFIDSIHATTLNTKLTEKFSTTELRILAMKINEMIDRLDKSFSRMRHFASIVSHELRTPLTIIRGELEIALHSQKNQEEYQVIIASSLDEVIRLNNVVNSLLDLSRAEEGRLNLNLNRESISKLVEDITEDAVILAESKEITVESGIEPGIFAVCDIARLHQALLNIVDNAIKYTSPHGRMSINLLRTGNDIEVVISDSGYGIPKEAIPNIFDRFFRLNSGKTKDIQGSGLGLSIVKWIVDAHNGRIEVNSEEKKGTEFRVIIPAA